MRIINAIWELSCNILIIQCECRYEIAHRADRWNVKCANCGRMGTLREIRERYLKEKNETEVPL